MAQLSIYVSDEMKHKLEALRLKKSIEANRIIPMGKMFFEALDEWLSKQPDWHSKKDKKDK